MTALVDRNAPRDALTLESTFIGQLELRFEFLAAPHTFGEGGLHMPLRFVAGSIAGPFVDAAILYGSDWASVAGTGSIRHRGTLLCSLDGEPLVVDVAGVSVGPETLVDDLFDEVVPGPIGCRLSLQVLTESRHRSRLHRQLLVAAGTFDFRRTTISCGLFGIA